MRVVIVLLPIVVSLLVGWAAAKWVPPARVGVGKWTWMALLFVAATATLVVFDRIVRRLTPLVVLMKLSLIFPDHAPSRFSVAMRNGTTRSLQRRIDEIRATGLALDDETAYAEQMLELVAALSVHDRLTRGHCERVRAYTELVIEEMGLPEHDASRLRWAALLHDVGKIMVPYEILNKDGKPTDEEWEILKSHTWHGQRMVEPLADFLGEWGQAVGQHHERWDGGGYPNGLAGTDIHLGARIVSVTDAYDVMTSARSYKKPLPVHVAREEVARCAGTQFDPAVVRAFLNVSLGKLRFATGPLAWLSSLPNLQTLPISSAISTVGSSAGAAAAAGVAAVSGFVAAPAAPPEPGPQLAYVEEVDAFELDLPLPTATPVLEPVQQALESPTPEPVPADAPAEEPTPTPEPTAQPEPTATPEPTPTSEPTTEPTPTPRATSTPRPAPTATPRPAVVPTATPTAVPTPTPPPMPTPTPTPRPAPPLVGQTLGTVEDSPVVVDLGLLDDAVLLTVVNPPNHGSLSAPQLLLRRTITYTPSPESNGMDTFVLRACDGAQCTTAAYNVNVAPVDDAPVAIDDAASIAEDATAMIDVSANDSDPDGTGPFTIAIVGGPTDTLGAQRGSAAVVGSRIRFTPPQDATGEFRIDYQRCDDTALCDTARLTVTVLGLPDPPVAADDAVSIPEDTTATGSVAANDIDPDGDTLTYRTTGAPTPGLSMPASGSFTYVPPPNWNGLVTVPYEVCDPVSLCDTATLRITVTPVNDAPVAVDDAASTNESTPVGGDVSTNDSDPDGDALTYSAVGPVPSGFVLDPTGTWVLTPPIGESGERTVTIAACDPAPACDTSTLTITIIGVADPPVAAADTATTDEDTFVIVDVSANDTDPDGDLDPTTITITTPPTNGTATLTTGNQIRYTPDPDT
ncbi:MAG: tandem-95 repeat protein, partial [Acidimicrobiales bacterium]|nr:tandem-95 repeat protein [Acidimicrobiales bacterium]